MHSDFFFCLGGGMVNTTVHMGKQNTSLLRVRAIFFKLAKSKNTSPWAPTFPLKPELSWDGKFQKQCYDNPPLSLTFRGPVERPCVFNMQFLCLLFCHSIFSPLPTIFEILRKRWWGTGKPGMLQSMGSQIVRQDWVTEQLGRVTTTFPAHPHLPHSGQAGGWLGTQRCRACEETTMGAVSGALGAWKWDCALSCLHIPFSGDPGKARSSLSRCALRQRSSCLSKPAHRHPFTNGFGIWFPNLPGIWISYSAMSGSKSLTPFNPTELRRLSTSKGLYSDLPWDSPGCHHWKSQGVLAPSLSKSFQLWR